jgi:hypothetical protein
MVVLSKLINANDEDSAYNEKKEGPNLPFWNMDELLKEMQM